ncbi:MAG: ATP-binding protein [Gammaproteobacteria bacterium]|jgi:predicted AAA+ superfamily ATPase
MSKTRYLEQTISNICFANNKMAFVSGPRQVGKTTMSKHLLQQRGCGKYYNWDETIFRRLWTKNPSQILIQPKNKTKPLIILDEIHKAKLWKRSLKGIFDTMDKTNDILVTGSARLNTYRKGSDSLMGRYYHFLLHPFSLAELLKSKMILPENLITTLFTGKNAQNKTAAKYLRLLNKFGPFPEPLLAASEKTLNLWRKNRLEKIIREDLRDLSRIHELSQIEMLASLLPEKAANPLSVQSLSEDLEVTYGTMRRWLTCLQELYYHYEIKPYTNSLKRSVKKMGKIYLWDWSEIENQAARFENLIASHLLKYCNYLSDTGHGNFELRFLRNKDGQEIDFILLKNKEPWLPIEVKLNQNKLSQNWKTFLKLLPCKRGLQVVNQSNIYEKITTEYGEILIISADIFLRYLI